MASSLKSQKKQLGNAPSRWGYDEKNRKLSTLFREGGTCYLLIEKGFISENVGESRMGVSDSGKKYILRNACGNI